MTLSETTVVSVGNLDVPVTPKLRELFSSIYGEMSGSNLAEMQSEMYLECEVLAANPKFLNEEETEQNLLELIHFLDGEGVAIPDISAEVRTFGDLTRSLSRRLHCANAKRARERREQEEAIRAREAYLIPFREPVAV